MRQNAQLVYGVHTAHIDDTQNEITKGYCISTCKLWGQKKAVVPLEKDVLGVPGPRFIEHQPRAFYGTFLDGLVTDFLKRKEKKRRLRSTPYRTSVQITV